MNASLMTRLTRLELFTPIGDEAKKITRILIVGPDECIELRLPGHPSQRGKPQMTFHKTPTTNRGSKWLIHKSGNCVTEHPHDRRIGSAIDPS